MRPIGFSTGALAQSDVRRGLALVRGRGLSVVELSALRDAELAGVLAALPALDLDGFEYVSFHAPSAFRTLPERAVADRLYAELPPAWPVVVHPDAITDGAAWRSFGPRLCVENMDKRKPLGRTAAELQGVFELYPDASFCFDIGHARQVDPTMGVAAELLCRYGDRLRQVHISEVSARNRHEPISYTAMEAFRTVAHLVPETVPIVSEANVTADGLADELRTAAAALSPLARRSSEPARPLVQV